MFFIDFEGSTQFGKPENWDEKTHGPCQALPVLIEDGVYYSYWGFSWRQRLEILFGRPLRLAILGMQPPVSLVVVKEAGR
jgi:hypothetical protein